MSYLDELAPADGTLQVFTEYSAGAFVGFWLEGRARIFLDTRTPLYWDDTDYGVWRDMEHLEAWDNGVARFGIDVAVVGRSQPNCTMLAEAWTPVLVEPQFTTFVPPGQGRGLQTISPCSAGFILPSACSEPDAFEADRAQMAPHLAASFAGYLSAARGAICGASADEIGGLIPTRREAHAYLDDWRRVNARYLLLAGEIEAGLDAIEEAVLAGDFSALGTIPGEMLETLPVDRLTALLEQISEQAGDAMLPEIRGYLAALCATTGDLECARFHGLRAAVRGDQRALPVLEWLIEHHPSERIQNDTRAWLETLTAPRN